MKCNKKRKLMFKRTLIEIMVWQSIAGLIIPVILCFFMFWYRQYELVWLLLLCMVLQVCIYINNIISYKKKIYDLLIIVEKVIHGFATGTSEINTIQVSEADELYDLYQDLQSIMSTLEELAAREAGAVLMRKQAELDALQSQINPHFLYNTLEVIRGQAIMYGIKDIEVMTKALSNLFRYSISNNGNMVPFSCELKNIDNYLKIQQCRFNNRIKKIEDIDSDTLDCKIPKLLIQPLVENAIYHGLEQKLGKGILMLKAYRTEERLIIHVIDDGLGIEEKKLYTINETLRKGIASEKLKKSGMRIGIANVNERIRLAFGEEYGLRLYSTENIGTDVEIILPIWNK